MSTSNIDYKTTNFEFPVLTKITGQPHYELLKTIKNELKSNASSVPCDLGGGNNGHLGLILTPAEQLVISPTIYVRPVHPGLLVIPAGPPAVPQYLRTEMKEDHKEAIRLFREANNVEKALLKQLSEAIPELYLKRFRSRHTNTLTASLPVILAYLFQTYGDISEEELTSADETLKAKVFDITQPIEVMYNEIQDLQDLATAANNAYSDKQLVSLGIHLVKNMNDFEKGLIDWYARPTVDHNYTNFKSHFEGAYQTLRKVRGITMKNSIFHQQANSVTERVLQEIKLDNQIVKDEIKATEAKLFSVFENIADYHSNDNNDENLPPQSSVNLATTNNNVQLEILNALKDLKLEMTKIGSNKRPREQKGDRDRKKQKRRYRKDTSKYCWTCGAGNHLSKNCRKKAENHKDEASFTNKMGGCTDFCQNLE